MPPEAVKAYHGELEKLKIKPSRALKEIWKRRVTASYAGTGGGTAAGSAKPQAAKKEVATENGSGQNSRHESGCIPKRTDGAIDFKKMTPAQKVAFSRDRIRSDMNSTNGNGRDVIR